MKFWDASALVPLCVEQPDSSEVARILQADPDLAVWWGSPIECWSAFARLRREGLLTVESEDSARELLRRLANSWTEIQPGEEVRVQAGRLVRTHPLRSQDAIQLAAALVWARGGTGEVVVLDRRLSGIARLEGLVPKP